MTDTAALNEFLEYLFLSQFENSQREPDSSSTLARVSFELGEAYVEIFAEALQARLFAGLWIFLDADLGAGKTYLVSALSRAFGLQESALSPTFSVLQVMEPLPKGEARGITRLVHLDLYRINSWREMCYLGLETEFSPSTSVALFEWPDRIELEEWQHFFNLTGCRRPAALLTIGISHCANPAARIYELTLSSNPFGVGAS